MSKEKIMSSQANLLNTKSGAVHRYRGSTPRLAACGVLLPERTAGVTADAVNCPNCLRALTTNSAG